MGRRGRRPPIERKLEAASGKDLDQVAAELLNLERAPGEPDAEFRMRVLHVALRPHVGTATSQMFRRSKQQPKNMEELLEMEAKEKEKPHDPRFWSPADLAKMRERPTSAEEFKTEIMGQYVPPEEPEPPKRLPPGQEQRRTSPVSFLGTEDEQLIPAGIAPVKGGPLKVKKGALRYGDIQLTKEDLEGFTPTKLSDILSKEMTERLAGIQVDTAVGRDLDQIGALLGVSRNPADTDELFRIRLIEGAFDEREKPKPKEGPKRKASKDWGWG